MSTVAVESSSPGAPARPFPFDPLPGTGYRAVRRLGGGSTSEVYEAVGPARVRCAVKVLRDLFVDAPEEVERLEREGFTLAALDHAALARVLDAGTTADGRPFFAMPLYEGETVQRRIARLGPFPAGEACAIVIDVLDALDAAHRAGVVHRDVKPANVFLAERRGQPGPRRPVLLDFGIAKLRGIAVSRTTGARVVGSPRYLAPEQILDGLVDARTDVYAVGLTLFEMIAGRGPFDAETPVDLMRAHLEEPGVSLRSVSRVSHELAHAVARATAKQPSRRWPSARAFAAVLGRVAEASDGLAMETPS
jgi:serine/threonine-protein kinase